MFGGSYEYEDDNGNRWDGLGHDPDERFGSNDNELARIGEENGWANWGDFYDDKLGLSGDDPSESRPPFLGEIDDLIKDLYDRGILDYTRFDFDGDYVNYEIDVDTT